MVRHLRLHAGFSALILGSNGAGEFGRAYRYTLADDAVTKELKGDRDVVTPHFSPSGRYRACLQRERPNGDGRHGHGHWRAHRPERRSRAGDISDLGFRQDEGRIVFTTSPSTSPTDVFIADVDDLVETVVVHSQRGGGVTIPANLYCPKNTSFDAAASVIEYCSGPPRPIAADRAALGDADRSGPHLAALLGLGQARKAESPTAGGHGAWCRSEPHVRV